MNSKILKHQTINYNNFKKILCKAAPTRASNLCKLVCTNCLTTAPDGTSMWRKLSGCSSYGVNFFNSVLEYALIELYFFYITYFFSTFRYFSLYLFSNLAFRSFFLFLHLVLVTHHRAGSDLYSSINSIKNCYSSAVPLEDIARSILLQITTAGTTTRCQLRVILRFVCANKHSDGASIGCLRKKYQTVLISRKHANNTLHCQAICANTLFAQIACTCRGRFSFLEITWREQMHKVAFQMIWNEFKLFLNCS